MHLHSLRLFCFSYVFFFCSFPLLPFSSNTNWSNVCKFIKVIVGSTNNFLKKTFGFQIKCTTRYEKLLFFLGVVFSILTGMCQPFESYTLGETSQVLVKVTNAINNKTIGELNCFICMLVLCIRLLKRIVKAVKLSLTAFQTLSILRMLTNFLKVI